MWNRDRINKINNYKAAKGKTTEKLETATKEKTAVKLNSTLM